MDITLICHDNRDNIIMDAMAQIDFIAECKLDWEINQIGMAIFATSRCNSHIAAVEDYFDRIIESYPMIDINASYSYSVREEDGSGQWWEAIEISTEKNSDGSRYLKKSLCTYWH